VTFLGLSEQIIFAGKIPENGRVSHCLADAYVMPSYGEGYLVSYFSKLLSGVPAGDSGICNSDEFPRSRNVATCARKARSV
jgi:hypothetical protein